MWVVIYRLKGSSEKHEPADYCTQKDEAMAVLQAFEDMFLALAKLGQLEGYEMDLIDPLGNPNYYRSSMGSV